MERSAGARALLWTEARLFVREPGAWFWVLVFPTALLCAIALVPSFREPTPDLGGARVLDLYVPVCVLLAVLVAGVQTMPPVLTSYRERGIVTRLRTTPLSAGTLLLAQVLVHAVAVLVSVVLVLVVGRAGFGVPLPASPLGYAVALVLVVAAMSGLGALVTAVSPTTKVAQAVGTSLLFPMMFTSGVWLPVQVMPQLLGQVVGYTPLGAGAQALGDAMAGAFPSALDLGVVAGWAVVLGVAAVRWFRWA
ncbi:ABC transporter permease [Phycicoccus endophyticus]|uniref:Transport permease protein n=1 Tax=Phycicoccus endophyticus TaxID=1690220 RepID=A0A7G9R684_9MICO|nr:ABC transporter permease [Phycicoccus endophyticus]QNN51109.1 ABC transporter permease [Phycicoccus endophyticus]